MYLPSDSPPQHATGLFKRRHSMPHVQSLGDLSDRRPSSSLPHLGASSLNASRSPSKQSSFSEPAGGSLRQLSKQSSASRAASVPDLSSWTESPWSRQSSGSSSLDRSLLSLPSPNFSVGRAPTTCPDVQLYMRDIVGALRHLKRRRTTQQDDQLRMQALKSLRKQTQLVCGVLELKYANEYTFVENRDEFGMNEVNVVDFVDQAALDEVEDYFRVLRDQLEELRLNRMKWLYAPEAFIVERQLKMVKKYEATFLPHWIKPDDIYDKVKKLSSSQTTPLRYPGGESIDRTLDQLGGTS